MQRRLLTQWIVAVLVVLLAAMPALAAKKKRPVKIGLLYALSGMAAVVTQGTVIGHKIAAEEINAKGGILGHKIEYVTRDNKLKPGIAVKEFRRLVTRDQVDFVMGVISSGVALAVSQVAKEMKVLFVDTIAQTSALTGEQGHRYVIRTNTNTTTLGRTAALAAARQPWTKYYFIGPDYEYGHVVNNDFWTYLQTKKEGVEKIGELWPKLGERDFSSHITPILEAEPDAVFSSVWGGDLIAFIKQAKAYGFFDKTRFISTGAGDLDILKPLGQEMPDGIMATFFYAFDMPVPGEEKANAEFVAEFEKRAGYKPKSGDIAGYISTHMLAEALAKGNAFTADGKVDTEKLVDTIRGMSFDTVLGKVTIRDFDGQATFGYYTGFTYTNPSYPFKRLKDVIRTEGSEVLRTKEEIEKARAEYQQKGS
jgi:branched-chain amino acid transport system substrate-binding protein